MHPTPCIHTNGSGLCPDCQAEYDTDPTAWEEYGHHAEGERRWAELRAEMNAREPAAPVDTSDYPL